MIIEKINMFGLVVLMGVMSQRANAQIPPVPPGSPEIVGINGDFQKAYTAQCPKCGESARSKEVRNNGGRTDGAGGYWESSSVMFHCKKCGYMFSGQLPDTHVPKIVVNEIFVYVPATNSDYMKVSMTPKAQNGGYTKAVLRTPKMTESRPTVQNPMDMGQMTKAINELSNSIRRLEQKMNK